MAIIVPGIEARHTWTAADGTVIALGGVDPASLTAWPRYEIRGIDGRHDRPEAQDKRRDAHARMGEIADWAPLRGKTEAWQVLVKGRTAQEMRQGEALLSEAFAENEVGTMRIAMPRSFGGRLFDPFDFATDFARDWAFDAGAGTLAPSGGELVPSSTAAKFLHLVAPKYTDFDITFHFRTGATLPAAGLGVRARRIDASNRLVAYVVPSNGELAIAKFDGGAFTKLAFAPGAALGTNSDRWIRFDGVGDYLRTRLYTGDPAEGWAPVRTTEHTLVGADATKFGKGIAGEVGIHIDSIPTDYRYKSFEVRGAYDLTYRARGLSYSAPDRQEYRPDQVEARGTDGWIRKATLGLRLHDPRYYEDFDRSSTLNAPAAPVGLTVPITVPFSILAPTDSFGPHAITRDGNAPTDPVIELWGPWTDPQVIDQAKGVQLAFGGLTLSSGQHVDLDFANRTAMIGTDSVRDLIDWSISSWWDAGAHGLRKGVPSLAYAGRSIAPPAKAVVRWRNASY